MLFYMASMGTPLPLPLPRAGRPLPSIRKRPIGGCGPPCARGWQRRVAVA
eukprot:COSAG06_NODE_27122_length_600_cov_1.431138_1_plen_49_part_10